MDALKKMMLLLLMMMMMMIAVSGCGEPPGETPTLPVPTVWTGSILVRASLKVTADSTVTPDSIFIDIDGDSLGIFANSDTLSDIPEGTHAVKFAGLWDGLIYRSRSYSVTVSYNAISLVEPALTRSGNLKVQGLYNGSPAAVKVKLGSDTLDYTPYPAPPEEQFVSYQDVPMGTFDLTAFWLDDVISIEGWHKDVVIEAAETTTITVDLIDVAPDSGAHAPGLEALDLDGNTWSLADHWGKVVMLYLFEGT